jgi:hypothetical protein
LDNVVYSNLTSVKRDEYLSMIGIEDVKYGKIKCAGWIQITADDKTLEDAIAVKIWQNSINLLL